MSEQRVTPEAEAEAEPRTGVAVPPMPTAPLDTPSAPAAAPDPAHAGGDDAPGAVSDPDAASVPDAGPAPGTGRRSRRPSRRVVRAVARWTLAAVVFGAVGGGTAWAVTSMERGDVPGLATGTDGRWDYPELSLPALPAGSPRPYSVSNLGEIHHADLRELLLPAPAGAVPDKKLTGGWITADVFLREYEESERETLGPTIAEAAPRHVAATGWTVPDGTRTRIYLLQFNSVALASEVYDGISAADEAGAPLVEAPEAELDESWDGDKVRGVTSYVFQEVEPYGKEHTRQAYAVAGDTLALVVQGRPGGDAARVPFHQTVILQNQLLG